MSVDSRSARFSAIPLGSSANREGTDGKIPRSNGDSGRGRNDGHTRVAARKARDHAYRLYAGSISAAAFLGATILALYQSVGR
jgi:hypothetical protein